MANSDSIFLFEITLEDLKSYIPQQNFRIKCQFKDVFEVHLRNPNELYAESLLPKKKNKVVRKKCRKGLLVPSCQAAIVSTDTESLISRMRQYPIELILWSKDKSYSLGLSEIPWNQIFINYLEDPNAESLPSKSFREKYVVFDEYTSRRMAVATLKIQLTKLKEIPEEILKTPRPLCGVKSNDDPFATCETPITTEITGTIKTIYSGVKHKFSKPYLDKNKTKGLNEATIDEVPNVGKSKLEMEKINDDKNIYDRLKKISFTTNAGKLEKSILSLVRSETELDSSKQFELKKYKSSSTIEVKERLDTLHYIFGDHKGPFGNQTYWVEYFTVENDSPTAESRTGKSSRSPSPSDGRTIASEKTGQSPKGYFQFKVCESNCKVEGIDTNPCFENICSTDLPEEAARLISIRKCAEVVECDNRRERVSLLPVDKPIFLKMPKPEERYEQIEHIQGGVGAKMKVGDDPCFCTCECTFGFVKRTTFCKVCGGFEKVGEDIAEITTDPFPCPIYHKLDQKKKKKTDDTAFSERSRKRSPAVAKDAASDKAQMAEKLGSLTDKKNESEKGHKKGKKKKLEDERFKFNYGYTAPKIGHHDCFVGCGGVALTNVPKNMGWLWTASNVPGLKFRPNYRPGATNRKVVRMLKAAKNPDLLLARRRKKQEAGKYKRPLKRPLLVIQKKDGEYTVTMETMKSYLKPRYPNQPPYEDKPVLTYTIGRTEEENRERARKKAREQRRLERYQREFIQSTFRDMCKEICMNTYRQALQFLPHTEDPPCSCFPALPGPDRINLDHSCSCSEASKSSIGSATDDDEWIVEFTPPVAYYNPAYTGKKIIKVDNSSQYTYLDYRVKLLDRFGNPVPRFFKYLDGSIMCSDLGGFWGPDDKWLEINVDGFIGPDERWAPNTFIGPNGEQVDAEAGKFQAANGDWLVVGVDGYVDAQNKWRFYSRPTGGGNGKNAKRDHCKKQNEKKCAKEASKPSEATWSCFGDASPKDLSQLGILGHGHDRQLLMSKLEKMAGERNMSRIPPHQKSKKSKHGRGASTDYDTQKYFSERNKCAHHPPSGKGIIAVDGHGNKTFFRLKDYKNQRPKERLVTLKKEGFSLSSFHVPCFSSFINSEVMRQQQIEHILRHNERVTRSTGAQIG